MLCNKQPWLHRPSRMAGGPAAESRLLVAHYPASQTTARVGTPRSPLTGFPSQAKIAPSDPAIHCLRTQRLSGKRKAKEQNVDAVHPGYGFLSEDADFSRRMWEEAGIHVVGPGWRILERTGDKLAAKALAREAGVPVLEATDRPVELEGARAFMQRLGSSVPVMLKAVDGGGGRGIRIVRHADDLPRLARLAMAESPSKQVFVERAAVDGFRHVEIQIIGESKAAVQDLSLHALEARLSALDVAVVGLRVCRCVHVSMR